MSPPCYAGTPRGRPSRELAGTIPSTGRPPYFLTWSGSSVCASPWKGGLSKLAYASGGTPLASWLCFNLECSGCGFEVAHAVAVRLRRAIRVLLNSMQASWMVNMVHADCNECADSLGNWIQ